MSHVFWDSLYMSDMRVQQGIQCTWAATCGTVCSTGECNGVHIHGLPHVELYTVQESTVGFILTATCGTVCSTIEYSKVYKNCHL